MHLVSSVISIIKMRYQFWIDGLLPAALARWKNSQNLTDQTWGCIGGLQHARAVRGECGVLSGTPYRRGVRLMGSWIGELASFGLRALSTIWAKPAAAVNRNCNGAL